jgi:hypothetical protein
MKNNKMLLISCSGEPPEANDTTVDGIPDSCRQVDRDCVVYCKQVNRMVPDLVCIAFRKQVGETGRNACAGCLIDAVVYRPTETIREGLRYYNA